MGKRNLVQEFDVETQLALRRNLEQRLQSIRQVVVQALDAQLHNPDTIKEGVTAIYKDSLGLNTSVNFDLIGRCIDLGLELHHGERRDSGIPYLSHPLEVGYILCEIGADAITVGAGILHDVLEHDPDSDLETTVLEKLNPWGYEIFDVVNIVTKPDLDDDLHEMTPARQKAAAIIQIKKHSVGGLKERTYPVKVADRLNNLLTLEGLKDKPPASAEERAKTILSNTRYVLPLAKEVDRMYANRGSGLLLHPYLQHLMGELKRNF